MVILLTGFEPWGEWKRNPSGEIATSLAGETIGGATVVSVTLPVEHGEDVDRVVPLIEKHKPSAVVSLGLNASATALNVERVAVNLRGGDGADGPADAPIVEAGPAAYFATLPTRDMVQGIQKAGVPARLSSSAGTFLCNHIMYNVLHYLSAHGSETIAGFIHIPRLPEQGLGGGPSMPLDLMRRGVSASVETIAGFAVEGAQV
jgi:pyroglutamyl-peptidase